MSVQLHTYTGEHIPVHGTVCVPVEHNGQSVTLPLIVTRGRKQSISLQQMLDKHTEKHTEVISEGLGKLKNTIAKIYIAQDE